jgi:DNA-binding NtrC family response regulator
MVERAAIVAAGPEILPRDFQAHDHHRAVHDNDLFTRTRPLDQARDELEKVYLEGQLARFGWNISRAAKELEVERSRLSRRLKQLGIVKPEPYAAQEHRPC